MGETKPTQRDRHRHYSRSEPWLFDKVYGDISRGKLFNSLHNKLHEVLPSISPSMFVCLRQFKSGLCLCNLGGYMNAMLKEGKSEHWSLTALMEYKGHQ